MAEEQQEPTAEAIKQRKKREKEATKNAALGIEKFTIEVAGVFKPDLKRLMKEHGFNNQQEVYQNLLRNVIAADFETASDMLRCATTPYETSEKVSRAFRDESLTELKRDPGDEIISPDEETFFVFRNRNTLAFKH
ncbi:hypothetical protein [Pseudomonas fluorescens]|uniref:Uncharacterized protein n=1 Tax=Pseudomonas fluorescens TaxID=294 RepID=A0A5E7NAC2_PSEFL|nr:hypothetical protein [Pseudomonas fluorescens]VVP34118.1 hypothetical protein PS880_04492 [Pseudomonas fluorescens]